MLTLTYRRDLMHTALGEMKMAGHLSLAGAVVAFCGVACTAWESGAAGSYGVLVCVGRQGIHRQALKALWVCFSSSRRVTS